MSFSSVNTIQTIYVHPPVSVISSLNAIEIDTTNQRFFIFLQSGTITFANTTDVANTMNNIVNVYMLGGGGGGAARSYSTIDAIHYSAWGCGGGGSSTYVSNLAVCPLALSSQIVNVTIGLGGSGSADTLNYDYPQNAAGDGGASIVSTIDSLSQSTVLTAVGGFGGSTFFGGASASGTPGGTTPQALPGAGAGGSGSILSGISADSVAGQGGAGEYFQILDTIYALSGTTYVQYNGGYVCAGGGGGGSAFYSTSGASGGGAGAGSGGSDTVSAQNALANTGSGGGGGSALGGNGGSGLVIFSVNK